MARVSLEETIEKKLVQAFDRELEARGITDEGIEVPPGDVEMAGLGKLFRPFTRIWTRLKKDKAEKRPVKVTKREFIEAAKPMFKERARAMAKGIRTAARQRAKAFKEGKLPPVTMPALPVARTVALRQEPSHVREAVREEDTPYVGDWGY